MNRYKQVRLSNKLSQVALAKQLDVSHTTVQRIEKGQEPSDDVLAKYAELGLGMPNMELQRMRARMGLRLHHISRRFPGIPLDYFRRIENNAILADTELGIMVTALYTLLKKEHDETQ